MRIGSKKISIALSVLLFSVSLAAQRKDTLAPLRDFMKVAAGYKQIPMYLKMELQNKTNLITAEADTATVYGEFYLQNKSSYVQFGDYEQIVNDSIALLVINKAQAMVLYENAATVINQMKAMLGAAIPDSSIKMLAQRYTASETAIDKNTSLIILTGRDNIYNSLLPKEVIKMEYDIKQQIPQVITTTRRVLLPLDSADYRTLEKDPLQKDKLIHNDGDYFIVREQQSAFIFKKLLINKDAEINVPVKVSDRVEKGIDSEYKPIKGFENYTLTKND